MSIPYSSGRTSPKVLGTARQPSGSCRRWISRRAQFGAQPQNFDEQQSWNGTSGRRHSLGRMTVADL